MDIKDAVDYLKIKNRVTKQLIESGELWIDTLVEGEKKDIKAIETVLTELENSKKETQQVLNDYQELGKDYHKLECELEKKDNIINFMTKRIKEDSEWFYSDLDNKNENEIKEYFKKKVEEYFNEGDKI